MTGERRADGGHWPHTPRLLPWGVAALLAMQFLTPFHDIELRVSSPIDPTLDRLALGALLILWLCSVVCPRVIRPRGRRSSMDVALLLFVGIVVVSLLVNVERIAIDDEMQTAIKKVSVVLGFVVFFYIVATVVRAEELAAFAALIVGLGAVAAAGIIWEYRTGANVFYDIADALAPPGFAIADEAGDPRWGRPQITGPTSHGLAATALVSMALPFAVAALLNDADRRRRLLYAIAAAVILAGAMSTLRKTAAFAPAAALIPLLAYRPKQMLRIAPIGVLVIIAVQGASPGALGSIRSQLQPDSLARVGTVQDRVADYDAIRPDSSTYPVAGRGFGTYDHNKYRLLDNQYLGIRLGTGILGFAAYIGLWAAALLAAHRGIRSGDPTRSSVALAAAGAAAVFAVVSALFDVLAFPQVPYLFLACAAFAVVAAPVEGAQRGAVVAAARTRRWGIVTPVKP